MKTMNQLSKAAIALMATGSLLMSSCSKEKGTKANEQAQAAVTVQSNVDEICKDPTVQPKFSGDLASYLQTNTAYPEKARKNGVSGSVFVSFVVGTDGAVKHVEILKGCDSDLNAEALRVVNGMPKWVPGEKDGKPVSVQFNLPIRFTLEK
jgi:TonB family protein